MKTVIVLVMCIGVSSCMTFQKAQRRYATNVADTIFTTVITTVPRDSVRLVVKTDTTRIIERMRQGRATVTIIREPTNTTVLADCDSLTRSQQVATRIITQKWGVDPAYKVTSDRWRTVALTLIALALVGTSLYFLSHKFTVNVSRK